MVRLIPHVLSRYTRLTGGGYWLVIVTLEGVERPGWGYWLVIVTLEGVERPGGGYWLVIVTLEDV